MKILSVCVVLSLFGISYGVWKPCGGGSKVKSVNCNGVDMTGTKPCNLIKGKNATLVVEFQEDVDAENMQSICHGVIGALKIPFSGIDSNGCDGMDPKCPLKAGKPYTFSTNIFVKTEYPSISLAIQWEEKEKKSGKDSWCIVIPAKLG